MSLSAEQPHELPTEKRARLWVRGYWDGLQGIAPESNDPDYHQGYAQGEADASRDPFDEASDYYGEDEEEEEEGEDEDEDL